MKIINAEGYNRKLCFCYFVNYGKNIARGLYSVDVFM